MAFMTSKYRDLKNSEFNTIGDPLVVKELPGYTEDGPGKGFAQQISSRADDAVRMIRLLDPREGKRTASGTKFLGNLALINQQATLAKAQKRDFTGIGKTALQGAADTGKVIASTLAQVPVAGTGTHFVNGGKVGKEYLKGGGSGVGNFLRSIVGTGGGIQGHERVLSGDLVEVNKEAVDDLPNSLRTRILATSPQATVQQPATTFRDKLTEGGREAVRTRLRFSGQQNSKGRRLNNSIDQLNASDIRTGSPDAAEGGFFRDKDIIPFEFQVFDPSKGGRVDYIYFRAYLDSFSDDYVGDWNATKYVGRAENLYNYQSFDRSVTFAFKLAAHTREELSPLYKKINYLVGTTAPSYNIDQTFMRGVFCRMTIGDYLSMVPGFFNSINISWDTNYPWELGLENDISPVPIVPHLLNVSMTFKPVHNFNPTLGSSFITSDSFTQQEFRANNPLSTATVKPQDLGAAENVRELDLTKGTLAFPFRVQKSDEEVPKVVLNTLSDVPQRSLAKVQVTPPPPRPNLGTNTQIPYKTPLESDPFGG